MVSVVGIGYKPVIFVPLMKPTQLHHPMITLHLFFVSLWLLAFSLQIVFAASGRIKLHMRFGNWAFLIAAIWACTSFAVLPVMLRLDPTSYVDLFSLLGRMGLFSWLMFRAWRERRNLPAHARYVLLAMSQAFFSGFDLLPIPGLQGNYELAHWLSLSVPAAIVLYDLKVFRRVLPATLQGTALILAVQMLRVLIGHAAWWLSFAHFIARHSY